MDGGTRVGANQRQWGVALALHFLRDTYEPTHKPCAFADYLAKHRDTIVARAALYLSVGKK